MGSGAGAWLRCALKMRGRRLVGAAPHGGRRGGGGGRRQDPCMMAPGQAAHGGGAYDAWARAQYQAAGQTPFESIQIQMIQFNSKVSKHWPIGKALSRA
jgi:hypothetical protein